VKDENGDLLADSNRWKNYFSQLLNRVTIIWQVEIHTPGPLVLDLSSFEVEVAIANLKRYKLAGSNQIPAELIQAGGEILQTEIHNLNNSNWNTEEFPDMWKESIIVPFQKKDVKPDCCNYLGISLLSTS
jgi:hypothetical protein